MKGKIWRLSHMGYTDAFEVLGAMAALELVLIESGFKVEPGSGVAAFQKSYAGVMMKSDTTAGRAGLARHTLIA
jgi:aspartate aminotransferase-like enzyme